MKYPLWLQNIRGLHGKRKKPKKIKKLTSIFEIVTMWFLVRVERGPWEKYEESKKYVKSKFNNRLLSSLLAVLAQKIRFWPFLGRKMSFLVQKCTFLTKTAKSEESRLSLKFDFTTFLFSSYFSQGPLSTCTRNHIVPISEMDVKSLIFNFLGFFYISTVP